MECAGTQYLQDFDWSVRLALSSDNVSILREGILMLKITTSNPNGVVEETLIEFNEKDTDSFLSLLIDASKAARTIQS